jgi:predicted FMN-binding regulatory protein PaiB
VKFQYKADLEGTERYGLIAEEVATIYPELVVRDANGRIDGVRYDELAPMLLNEVQKQQQKIAAQDAKINQLQQQFAMLQAALVKLQSKDELVAQR